MYNDFKYRFFYLCCMQTSTFHSINCRGTLVDLTIPKIMGILNVTPDSFSDGGQYTTDLSAMRQAEKLILEGADIIDIGPQSTRPNAEKISAKEEIGRIGHLIKNIKTEFPKTLISVDTFYSDVVKWAADEGMDIINDISGGYYDENMFKTVAEVNLPYVLMHVNETYEEMHEKQIKEDVVLNINRYFSGKVLELLDYGIKDILLDPGFGFGKTIDQQFQMIDELEAIGYQDYPLFIGISRKSFIYKSLGKQPSEIQKETQDLHLKVLRKGAKILRVHDVAETKATLDQFLVENS